MKWGLSILALCALLAATAPEGGAAEQGGVVAAWGPLAHAIFRNA